MLSPGSSISRSSFAHEPAGETEQNLGLMRLIDRQFLDTPFTGVRKMTICRSLGGQPADGRGVNQKRIRRMRLMPDLVRRHHLSADAAHAPGSNRWRRDGLFLYPVVLHPQGAGLAQIEHAGGRVSRVESLNESIHRYGAPEIMRFAVHIFCLD
ncbi:hypothetical protein ACEUZ9_000516 [Paracoccus litorisediminis]|uniref:Uncharacterized protein n=1 Tax=Paracoccus litorisediminis TaxID=2006130 RepID=A0A844HH26_9RHOB|nr:hypothetical protein [Paracoccus litorisediminis]MTH59323.1 hypothetical protein [Paracoccus litorisediminis]